MNEYNVVLFADVIFYCIKAEFRIPQN